MPPAIIRPPTIPACVLVKPGGAMMFSIQVVTALTGTDYFLTQLIMSGWYALVVIGLCLLMGYAGQISLGHAAFFAIGGYTTAVLTTMNLLPYKNIARVKLLSAAGMTLAGTNSWGSTGMMMCSITPSSFTTPSASPFVTRGTSIVSLSVRDISWKSTCSICRSPNMFQFYISKYHQARKNP